MKYKKVTQHLTCARTIGSVLIILDERATLQTIPVVVKTSSPYLIAITQWSLVADSQIL